MIGGTKFMLYRSIPTLQHYILVDSSSFHVEKYTKNSDNSWVLTEIKDNTATLVFTNPDFTVSLSEIYEDTDIF